MRNARRLVLTAVAMLALSGFAYGASQNTDTTGGALASSYQGTGSSSEKTGKGGGTGGSTDTGSSMGGATGGSTGDTGSATDGTMGRYSSSMHPGSKSQGGKKY